MVVIINKQQLIPPSSLPPLPLQKKEEERLKSPPLKSPTLIMNAVFECPIRLFITRSKNDFNFPFGKSPYFIAIFLARFAITAVIVCRYWAYVRI